MNNLETKINDLDVDKFKIVTIDLRKLSDVSSIRIGVLEKFWLKISHLANHLNVLAFNLLLQVFNKKNNKKQANINPIVTVLSPNYSNSSQVLILLLPWNYMLLKLIQYNHLKKYKKITNCSKIFILTKLFWIPCINETVPKLLY